MWDVNEEAPESLRIKPEDSRAEEWKVWAVTDFSGHWTRPCLKHGLPLHWLRNAPPKDLIGQRQGRGVLGRCDINERYGVGRLSAWAPNTTTRILIRGRSDTERRQCDHRSRDWNDVATSHGVLAATRS